MFDLVKHHDKTGMVPGSQAAKKDETLIPIFSNLLEKVDNVIKTLKLQFLQNKDFF